MFSTFLAKIIVPAKNDSENNHVITNSNLTLFVQNLLTMSFLF